MNKSMLGWIGIVLILVVSVSVMGCRHGNQGAFFRPERVDQMLTWGINDALDRLEADRTQKQQVLALKDRLFQRGQALRRQGEGIRLSLLQEWKKDQPDMKRVHSLVDQGVELKRTFAHEFTDGIGELHHILTPEQRERLAARPEEHLTAK